VQENADPTHIDVQLTRKANADDGTIMRLTAKAFGGGYLAFFFELRLETARALHRVLTDAIAEADRRSHTLAIQTTPTLIERRPTRPTFWNRFYGRLLPW